MTLRSLESARVFLREVDAPLLAALLAHAKYAVLEREGWLGLEETYVEVHAPPQITKAIAGLPTWEKERIIKAIADSDDRVPVAGMGADRLVLNDVEGAELPARDQLLAELVCHRDMLIDVATGGARFHDVNDYYKRRRKRISDLLAPGSDPSPFDDLWDWHKYWSDEGFTTYAQRREYIGRLFDPVIEGLLDPSVQLAPRPLEPTGWERVDRALAKARAALETASVEEDYQLIGLLCREVLISLGQAVFNADIHSPPDEVTPSQTDAKRMLEGFIAHTVPGESNETVRRHARAALSLAIELQHRRTAHYRVAALCLEATSSTVNVIAILDGRRDRSA